MTRKQKKNLIRILLAAMLLIVLQFLPTTGLLRLGLYLIPYFIVGYDVLWKAVLGIWNRQLLDEDFLMAVATVGALVLGFCYTGDYLEAVAVLLLYQTGELFQSIAVGKSRKSIGKLMDIRPDYANIIIDGQLQQVDPDTVPVGTCIVVQPGEKIPLDGVVVEGTSCINTAALTGESLPRDVAPGDECISGCVNMTGLLYLRTTKVYGESTVSKILDLVENAASHKSQSEKFISKFARVYTPVVCSCALVLALLPPLVGLLAGGTPMWSRWLYRALSFLVASCPCALVISIPLTFFAGLGGASRAGILIKGSNYLETLAKTTQVVFDKTGTLTRGEFSVSYVKELTMSAEELLYYAAHAEAATSHPIGKSLLQAYGKAVDRSRVTELSEEIGGGVAAKVDAKRVLVGNQALMQKENLDVPTPEKTGTVVYVAVDGVLAGYFVVEDRVKESALQALKQLRKAGVKTLTMLTGDSEAAAQAAAQKLNIDRYFSRLLPGDKVDILEKQMEQKQAKEALLFVGDGINDAPVLSRADVGIAMGAMGSDAAIEAADVVLMDDDLQKVAKAIGIAKKCMAIARQNIVGSIAIKVAALLLVAVGVAGMWLAVFADVGVMVLAVLNAVRALYNK